MPDDPIVAEVREARQAHAARFHFDIDAIFQDLKDQERRSGSTFVRFSPRHPELEERVTTGRHGEEVSPPS